MSTEMHLKVTLSDEHRNSYRVLKDLDDFDALPDGLITDITLIEADDGFSMYKSKLSPPGREKLQRILAVIDDFDSFEELYAQLYQEDLTEDLDAYTWCEFDEYYFHGLSPFEVAKATYFGNIRSWTDSWIRFDDLGNLESTHRIPYESEGNEMIDLYLELREDDINDILESRYDNA